VVSTVANEVMAELSSQAQARVRLVLPRGRYRITARDGQRAWIADVTLREVPRSSSAPNRRRRAVAATSTSSGLKACTAASRTAVATSRSLPAVDPGDASYCDEGRVGFRISWARG
jgi:hypothetical protein